LSFQVINHPLNEVIFEGSFDDLVEKIGRKELVNVSTGKVRSKGLEE
jgi:hypothetical protein